MFLNFLPARERGAVTKNKKYFYDDNIYLPRGRGGCEWVGGWLVEINFIKEKKPPPRIRDHLTLFHQQDRADWW